MKIREHMTVIFEVLKGKSFFKINLLFDKLLRDFSEFLHQISNSNQLFIHFSSKFHQKILTSLKKSKFTTDKFSFYFITQNEHPNLIILYRNSLILEGGTFTTSSAIQIAIHKGEKPNRHLKCFVHFGEYASD